MKSCMLLSECHTLDTSNYGMGCSKCISGEKQCDDSHSGSKCWIPGMKYRRVTSTNAGY